MRRVLATDMKNHFKACYVAADRTDRVDSKKRTKACVVNSNTAGICIDFP